MDTLHALVPLIGTVLQFVYFIYSLVLAQRRRYRAATYYLILAFFLLIFTDSIK